MSDIQKLLPSYGVLPSADEMRKKMQTDLAKVDAQQLKEIAERIKHNFANGYCYWTSRVSMLVKRELNKAGYVLQETDNQRDGYSLMISWK